MGGCCSNEAAKNQGYADLSRRIQMDAKTLAIVIKAQAAFRGLITRRTIKAKYGFECKTSMMKRRLIEMDPAKVEENRQRVQEIRKKLGTFVYNKTPVYDASVSIV